MTRVYIPTIALVPTGATSSTLTTPVVSYRCVDDSRYFRPFYSQVPDTTAEIFGISIGVSLITISFRTLSRYWCGRRALTNSLLNGLPEAAIHAPYMVPISVDKDQQLASVTALRVASHVASAWRCTSFALMGEERWRLLPAGNYIWPPR